MIKEFNEIRIKLNAYQIAFLDSELNKRNKKIRQANADKAQGRLV